MPPAMIRRLQDQHDLDSSRAANPNFAGTLAKGLMILEAFVRESRPLGNSELAQALGLTRPTVSRLCRTLLELGYLDHDDRIDRYFIGPAAVALGYPYIVNTPLRTLARPGLQALAERFQGAASIGVAFGLDMVYLETCACPTSTLVGPTWVPRAAWQRQRWVAPGWPRSRRPSSARCWPRWPESDPRNGSAAAKASRSRSCTTPSAASR
jgi:hypothetical protein